MIMIPENKLFRMEKITGWVILPRTGSKVRHNWAMSQIMELKRTENSLFKLKVNIQWQNLAESGRKKIKPKVKLKQTCLLGRRERMVAIRSFLNN